MPKPTNNDRNLMRGEFSTVIDLDSFVAAEKDGNMPKEIPVLPKGEYMTLPYGNLVLNDSIFEQMVGNFKAGIRRAVPIDVDHSWENTKAAGWIKELLIKGDGLYAVPDWNKLGKELVGDRIYRMISAEWSFDYVDPQKSTHHGAVLVAATLTNRPLMQSMPTITASEGLTNGKGVVILFNENNKQYKNSMPTLEDILKKPATERTEDDLKVLKEKEAELTDEQKTQLETEKTEAADAEAKAKADAEAKEKADADAKAKADADADEDDLQADEKGNVTIKAEEVKRLRKIEAEKKAAEVLKAAEDFSNPFLASDKGGKVLPAGKNALITLSQSLSESQKALLQTVLSATADQKVTEVKGKDNKDGLTATEQYNTLIKELMAKGQSMGVANKEVRTKHADIYNAYLAESGQVKN